MSLLASQQAFMAQILDDEVPAPTAWTRRHAAGMQIYRNAYRARLVDALRDTFERTARWVGEDAFRQAAAHHLITSPPNSWTLDDAGQGFAETLAGLFPGDPEVAELAWLEWSMHSAFVAADAIVLDAAAFGEATASFGEADWAGFGLGFLPGMAQREMRHDILEMWQETAGEGTVERAAQPLAEPKHCVVWREGFKPVFMLLDDCEGASLAAMRGGASYGECCELLVERIGDERALARAGEMLARWIGEGLIVAVTAEGA